MEVKHKDHTIAYREGSNDWFSPEIGVKPSLAAAKKAIDDLARKGRRADVVALMIREPYWRSKSEAEIVVVKIGAMCEPRSQSSPITEAWVTYERGKSKEREKVSLSQLYAPADRAKVEEYVRLDNVSKEAATAAEKFKDTLPGLNAGRVAKMKEGGDPK